jgi:signal transduction histidine kinase
VQEETAPRPDAQDDLEHWRERVFGFVLILTIAFALPSLAIFSYSKAEQGRFVVALPFFGLYAVFVVLGLSRRIAWRKRALGFLACLFVAGALPIFEYGFRSQGPLLLLTAISASSVFLGVRASVTLFLLSLFALALGGVLFLTGVLEDNASHPLTSLSAWSSLTGTFLFIGLCMVATVGVLMRGLEANLATKHELVRDLRREVAAVEAEKSATLRELAERRRAERLLEQRDRVLGAIALSAERLLASQRWQDSAAEILASLGEAAGVSRATLVEVVHDPERGELLTVRFFQGLGEAHWAERPGLCELPVSSLGLEPFVARLRAKEAVLVRSADLPEAPRKLASELGMAVGLALPISVGDELWGFIGFESSDPAFELPATLSDMLRAAAGSLGAAMARDRLNAELEQRVLERTERLAQANDELKAFSFTVSHDLRAPLRQLGAYVGMLRESAGKGLDADSDRFLGAITQSAARMTNMIDDLLRFYTVSWSKLSVAPVDLAALVREVLGEHESETRGRELSFEIGTLPTVPADRALLKHAFSNLIGNAVKYTRPRPRAEVAIEAKTEGGSVILSVRDNGVGFEPNYAHRLFQVFQRLHSAHEFEGNGIGLAHVKRIVERHGGRVWATGSVGGGATFYVALPDSPRSLPVESGPALGAADPGVPPSVK